MKHIKLIGLCACILALILCLCAGEALGYVTVLSGTNVRGSNSSDSDIVGHVTDEGRYPYYELNGGWYKIQLSDGTMGYVYQSRVK